MYIKLFNRHGYNFWKDRSTAHDANFLPSRGIYKDREGFIDNSALYFIGENFIDAIFVCDECQPDRFHLKIGIPVLQDLLFAENRGWELALIMASCIASLVKIE